MKMKKKILEKFIKKTTKLITGKSVDKNWVEINKAGKKLTFKNTLAVNHSKLTESIQSMKPAFELQLLDVQVGYK